MPRPENASYPAAGVCPPESLPHDLVQILNPDGHLRESVTAPLSPSELLPVYRAMLRQRLVDDRMLTLQRQGRIGFYGACTGQEAAVFGCACALREQDWVVPALREAGVLLYRGLPLRSYFNQLLGNRDDVTQGRQMPCHPPGGGFRYVTMSSCIANQIPQSCGLALAARARGEDAVVLCFMGDGATSEGDFQVGLEQAARMKLAVVFVCQNNQWSISVPVGRQTAARSFAGKAKAFGMPGIRVDGNDVLAVRGAVGDAMDRARRGEGPTLVECLTYRLGAHTTSDDPTRYRDEAVTQRWWALDPLERTRKHLISVGIWSEEAEATARAEIDGEIRETWTAVEGTPAPELPALFGDVFAERSPQLREQQASLLRNLAWAEAKGLSRRE
jgi:pyruvate dehydrogenase E1 component alpha subunit/2-oxoisovalerate dehydrogenase E1 component alpha subunit